MGKWDGGKVGKWDVHTKTTDDNDSLILAYLSLAYLLFIYLSFTKKSHPREGVGSVS
jgi:hypothetical protein